MKTFSIKATIFAFSFLLLANTLYAQNNSDRDNRMKIRLGFTSSSNLHRQILVTVDSNATAGIDYGYDAENFENHIDDMYWMIDDRKFLIQGINSIDASTTLALGLHTGINGTNVISIESMINVPEDLEIGVLDTETNTYYNIKETTNFSVDLPAGEYLNRFKLKFENIEDANNTTSNEEEEEEEEIVEQIINNENNFDADLIKEDVAMELSYINRVKSISIKNIGKQNIKHVYVYSINGKLITIFDNIRAVDQILLEASHLNAGNYILLLTSDTGRMSKKITVK
ncbi:T9SS type A sorting domain-containing protein [Oceanihabitans sp. 2_MG-2023]|uniref:T9SS type A sorting domain-containing protein n=1 Tax=Oceanihabitans sp. 2_MG-2023 TaxID=3062661 RepID=UPI0026E281D6|nr:T9SS type A sorting domain-containing protein [Oceanihabitans sp. 2_MG-2023]MDO6596979.1 T9SS type A sorting domain-containing protein [Oceanihabitans sp. 2_MG-2023]